MLRHHPARAEGDFVLYWMIAARRASHNFALDRAIHWAKELGKPLVVLEALRCDYPWASDRLHRFVIDGMAANSRGFAKGPVLYHPYVEPRKGAGRGLLAALAERAAVVVTDEFPCFFLPRMVEAAASRVDARLEAVDSNGLLPLRSASKAFLQAAHFRWHVQRELPAQLHHAPHPAPLRTLRLPRLRALPAAIARRWPAAPPALLRGDARALAALPIADDVPAVALRGGADAARAVLRRFVSERLDDYAERRNHPDDQGTSGFSPYLHFGHLSVHQVLDAVARHESWTPDQLARRPNGRREGWWGMGASTEAFLDELVTWRELAYNGCAFRADYDRFESLPDWAQATLAEHARDPRPHRYTLAQLAAGETHDPLFNAAQHQLLRDGWFHGYLRMLWGKKILEWSSSPQRALATMIELMNRHSVDGRNPCSYAGYFWTLGRYDRPWPERAVFGKVRTMTSVSTRRKVRVERYLDKYA
ncbi:MAG: deoxyribodipyrimidine photolyase [Polyangiaceae bacterium]